MNRNIEAIIFDFVGVLLCRDAGDRPDPLVEAVDAMIGHVVDDPQFKTVVRQERQLSEAGFDAVLQAIVARYVPYQPLWDMLEELRQRYKLAVLNNGTLLTYPLFNARFHLDQTFDHFISSAREGVAKPDERIYGRACQKLDLPSDACLFMDDSLENVLAAQHAGMQAIHWPDHERGFERFLAYLKEAESKN